jgi:Zn-dependent protease
MKWSWRILTVRGIDVKVHITFIFALVWGATIWGQGSPSGWLYGVFLTIVLFSIVLLHELGHSIAAQRYGVEVHDIVLLPIGGVARLNRMPDKPLHELVVALAGPAVNLIFVLVLGPLLVVAMNAQPFGGFGFRLPSLAEPGWINFLAFLVAINASLLVFNMLPAFPMDGGRALRALLALKFSYGRATAFAVAVGRVFALLFGVAGFFSGNITLALVGMFVFFGAGAEYEEVSRRESLRGLTVSEVVDTQAPVLPGSLPAFAAFDRLSRTPYRVMAVVDDSGRLLGMVTSEGMQAKWTAGVRGTVSAFAEPSPVVVECGAPLELARERMAESRTPVAAVFCGSRFEGLLDFETISRVVALRKAGWAREQGAAPAES